MCLYIYIIFNFYYAIIIKYLKLDIIEYYNILDYSNAVSSLIYII